MGCKTCLDHGYFVSGKELSTCEDCARLSYLDDREESAAYLFVRGIENRDNWALTQLALMIEVVSFNNAIHKRPVNPSNYHGAERVKKKPIGRPRHFGCEAITCSLHLPAKFWELLEKVGGSRSSAFISALGSDAKVNQMRRILKMKSPQNGK